MSSNKIGKLSYDEVMNYISNVNKFTDVLLWDEDYKEVLYHRDRTYTIPLSPTDRICFAVGEYAVLGNVFNATPPYALINNMVHRAIGSDDYAKFIEIQFGLKGVRGTGEKRPEQKLTQYAEQFEVQQWKAVVEKWVETRSDVDTGLYTIPQLRYLKVLGDIATCDGESISLRTSNGVYRAMRTWWFDTTGNMLNMSIFLAEHHPDLLKVLDGEKLLRLAPEVYGTRKVTPPEKLPEQPINGWTVKEIRTLFSALLEKPYTAWPLPQDEMEFYGRKETIATWLTDQALNWLAMKMAPYKYCTLGEEVRNKLPKVVIGDATVADIRAHLEKLSYTFTSVSLDGKSFVRNQVLLKDMCLGFGDWKVGSLEWLYSKVGPFYRIDAVLTVRKSTCFFDPQPSLVYRPDLYCGTEIEVKVLMKELESYVEVRVPDYNGLWTSQTTIQIGPYAKTIAKWIECKRGIASLTRHIVQLLGEEKFTRLHRALHFIFVLDPGVYLFALKKEIIPDNRYLDVLGDIVTREGGARYGRAEEYISLKTPQAVYRAQLSWWFNTTNNMRNMSIFLAEHRPDLLARLEEKDFLLVPPETYGTLKVCPPEKISGQDVHGWTVKQIRDFLSYLATSTNVIPVLVQKESFTFYGSQKFMECPIFPETVLLLSHGLETEARTLNEWLGGLPTPLLKLLATVLKKDFEEVLHIFTHGKTPVEENKEVPDDVVIVEPEPVQIGVLQQRGLRVRLPVYVTENNGTMNKPTHYIDIEDLVLNDSSISARKIHPL